MVLNLCNWIWAFVSIYVIGLALSVLFEKIFPVKLDRIEARVALGLVFVTIYAQVFSLFYRVGTIANILLGIIVVVSVFIAGKRLKFCVLNMATKIRCMPTWNKGAIIIISLFFLGISASVPYLGDTYMYHIQAVEWIEKYGVVKGLGNLHFRFAYNSAYESLSALYSWSSLVGRSLHALNGFFAALMVSYCALTIDYKKFKLMPVSSLLKIAAVIYIFGRLMSYGSVDTDPLVMHCIAFIFIKCFELIERKESNIYLYGLLAIFGAYSVTLKLSAGLIVLLVLYPLIYLIREKKWKEIIIFFLLGILVTAPYLIRNVIISGYLIYPVTSIDLFNVDWKMPKSVVKIDSDGIIMWGRGVQYMDDPMSIGFTQWLPIWFKSLNMFSQILFLIDILAVIVFIVHCLKNVFLRKKYNQKDFIMFTAVASFIFWMQSAPLIRYGELYMWIVSLAVFGSIVASREILVVLTAGVLMSEMYGAINLSVDSCGLVVPADYKEFSVTGHDTDITYDDGSKVVIYIPNEGAQANYYYFPSTPETAQLENLEFRGNSIKDGFRSKLVE